MESSPAACCSTSQAEGRAVSGDNEAIYVEDLEAWEKKASFKVERAMRTGAHGALGARAREGPLDLNQATPGLYASCLKWLRERGAALLGSDVVQDVRPSQIAGVNQPIHQVGLQAMGMPLIDNAIWKLWPKLPPSAAAGRIC